MDWNVCIICQTKSNDLRCPADSKESNGLQIYSSFLQNVEEFVRLDALPVSVDFRLCTPELFMEHRAKWHKACHIKFATSKLNKVAFRNERKRHADVDTVNISRKSVRQSIPKLDKECCMFCLQSSDTLHSCSTLNMGSYLKTMALDLNDSMLLARLSGEDLVAMEAKYHARCLIAFRNRYRSVQRAKVATAKQKECSNETILLALAYGELFSYIESQIDVGETLFILAELHRLLQERLTILGVHTGTHRPTVKAKIMQRFKGKCDEQFDGRNTVLVFNSGLQELLKEALKFRDYNAQALSLMNTVKQIRTDMLDFETDTFTGKFLANYQQMSVLASLYSLVSLLA